MLTRLPRHDRHVIECTNVECPKKPHCMTTGEYYWHTVKSTGSFCQHKECTQLWSYIDWIQCDRCLHTFKECHDWLCNKHIVEYLTSTCGIPKSELKGINLCPTCIVEIANSQKGITMFNHKPMGIYRVYISETRRMPVEIVAFDEEDAIDRATRMYEGLPEGLDASDISYFEIEDDVRYLGICNMAEDLQ